MTQTNFLELAKTGEPRVIAGLLNRSLQNQGITSKATRRNEELHLLLEGESLQGHEDSVVEYITQALSRLQVPGMPIKVYARMPGQEQVIWRHNLDYAGPDEVGMPTMPANFTLPMPETAEPEMTPSPDFTEDYDDVPVSAAGSFGNTNFFDEAGGHSDLTDAGESYPYGEEGASNGRNYLLDSEEDTSETGTDFNAAVDDGSGFDEEEELPQKSGLPILPLTLAAIVALLFAGAGAYYRFIVFDQPAPVVTTPEVPDAGTEPPAEVTPVDTEPGDTEPGDIQPGDTPPVIEIPSDSPLSPPEITSADPWRDAINAAMDAAVQAQTAQTAEDWGNVAETWEQSIQLLLIVPEDHPQYTLAQDKVVEYTNNLDIARARELNARNQ